MFGIPVTNTKMDMTGMLLEALAAESYRTVTPIYYEMALKIKYVRDDISAIMIDLVREGVTADLALNSLLTNYDADLSEWYGMIASCQNIDEFYDVSAQFFLRTIYLFWSCAESSLLCLGFL